MGLLDKLDLKSLVNGIIFMDCGFEIRVKTFY